MQQVKSVLVVGAVVLAGFAGVAQANANLDGVSIHTATAEMLIAREASEGPRGGDNERPGDRQRRGGKHWDGAEKMTTAALDHDLIAREASSRGRGKDDRGPRR